MVKTILTSIFLLLVLSCESYGQDQSSTIIEESERFFIDGMKDSNIVGVSVAIISDGKVLWKKGFGDSDKEEKMPMTEETVINIGSITKTFTALSIMQLNEQGIMDINEPLKQYFPQFNPQTDGIDLNKVSVKSVITHSSGIQNDVWKNAELTAAKYTDVVDYINETYLMYPSGLVGLYSNSGYNILGHTIKNLSGSEYDEYVKRNIFSPLNMNHSGFAMDQLEGRTKLYSKGKVVKEYELRDIASGGIYSNLQDMLKYSLALIHSYHGKDSSVVKPNTIREMFTLQNEDLLIETNKKGLGWFMFKNDSSFAVYHSGSAGFAHAKLLIIPEQKFAVVAMTNSAEGGKLIEEFCFSFLDDHGLKTSNIVPTKSIGKISSGDIIHNISDEVLLKHTGNYAELTSHTSIELSNGKLILKRNEEDYHLLPLSQTEFTPYKIENGDTIALKEQQYIFKDFEDYHILFRRTKDSETPFGYKLKAIDTELWNLRTGAYEQFGDKMLVGDSEFTDAELDIEKNNVLYVTIRYIGGQMKLPLNVINQEYAVTGGLSTNFGCNVRFSENQEHYILDFNGLTFRKEKTTNR